MERAAKLLPWAAAISFGALAAAIIIALFRHEMSLLGGTQKAFPHALLVCIAVGAPMALGFRAGWQHFRAQGRFLLSAFALRRNGAGVADAAERTRRRD
jgi:hypothetical protein